jgi:hypothetical protein
MDFVAGRLLRDSQNQTSSCRIRDSQNKPLHAKFTVGGRTHFKEIQAFKREQVLPKGTQTLGKIPKSMKTHQFLITFYKHTLCDVFLLLLENTLLPWRATLLKHHVFCRLFTHTWPAQFMHHFALQGLIHKEVLIVSQSFVEKGLAS